MTLVFEAPAKINLHLRVSGCRADGFHEVRTLLQTIDLVDELRARPASAGVLEIRVDPDQSVPTGEDNLVSRAAHALRDRAGVSGGAEIELIKRIPVGAGLGGGSSDAAATLVMLDALWDLHLEKKVLEDIAADLGSDVPFFLTGGLAWATGRGEIVRPLPDFMSHAVLVCVPPIEVSTRDVYDQFSADPRLTSGSPDATVDLFAAASERSLESTPPWNSLENDLEPVVVENWPEVGRVVEALRVAGPLHAAVTGSGAAAFAIFSDIESAREGAAGLEDHWNVYITSTIGRVRGRPMVKTEGREEERP
jgi:4-diphosphocytidyl-2-C-methyl-D-erythritol kinase